MRTDEGIEEVIARLRSRRLSVCDSCDGQGYTDMGKSACFWCRGAGVVTQQMAYAFGVADRAERSDGPLLATVPRVLSVEMAKALHDAVRIRCEPERREASILNDREVWDVLLKAAESGR